MNATGRTNGRQVAILPAKFVSARRLFGDLQHSIHGGWSPPTDKGHLACRISSSRDKKFYIRSAQSRGRGRGQGAGPGGGYGIQEIIIATLPIIRDLV